MEHLRDKYSYYLQLITRIAFALLSAYSYFLLARHYSVSTVGKIAIVNMYYSVYPSLINYARDIRILRYFSNNRVVTKSTEEIIQNGKGITFALSILILPILLFQGDKPIMAIIYILSFLLVAKNLNYVAVDIGQNRSWSALIYRDIISTTIFFIIIIIGFEEDYIVYGLILCKIIPGLLRKINFHNLSINEQMSIRELTPIFLASLTIMIFMNIELISAQYFLDEAQIGLLAIPVRLAAFLLMPSAILMNNVGGDISIKKLLDIKYLNRYIYYWKRSVIGVVFGGLILISFSTEFLQFFGEQYATADTERLLVYLVIAQIIRVAYGPLSSILINSNKTYIPIVSVLISLVVYFLISLNTQVTGYLYQIGLALLIAAIVDGGIKLKFIYKYVQSEKNSF